MSTNSAGARLAALARTEFRRKLTDAEQALLHAAATGEWSFYDADRHDWMTVDAEEPPNAEGPTNLPEFSEIGDVARKLQPWGTDRNVRAGLLRWLCASEKAKTLVDPSGLRLIGARITCPLNLDFVRVSFPVEFRCCRFTEPVSMNHAIVPNVSMAGSWTRGISAIGLVVSGSVRMNLGFHVEGAIVLVGAKIDGDVDLMSATILSGDRSGGWAIVADNVKAVNVFLSSHWKKKGTRFRAEGTVSFPNATISGDFGAFDAEFTPGQGHREALSLQRATVVGSLTLGSVRDSFKVHDNGHVDLRGTRCGRFEESDWYGPVRLDGFTYENTKRSWDADSRIRWLQRDMDGATQPYYHLAKHFDDIGRTADAKKIRIALEDKLYSQDDNPLKFLKKPIGYGYRPENALIGLAAICAVGWIVYWRSYRMGMMVPSQKDAAETLRTSGNLPAHYPRFQPLVASIERTFPLVKLGQADTWQPDPNPAPPFAGEFPQRLRQFFDLRRSLRWFIWVQILLGWLLATLFVAAVTGLVHCGT